MLEKDLKSLSFEELEELMKCMGQKKYLAQYVFSFIHEKRIFDIDKITPLSKDFRSLLKKNGYYISSLNIVNKLQDPDGTIKFQFELEDKEKVEGVLLFDEDRKTLCISSQIGCNMNCSFCATGKLKFKRNLKAAEIIDQVYAVENKEELKISNLVYMGMGEPFENYYEVMKSIKIINHNKGANIGARHITVSTCGIVPGIKKYSQEDINSKLAISLNAPADELRNKIMSINRKYPLYELMDAVRQYQNIKKQRVTFEYVLIAGVNDSSEHAKELVNLIKNFNCKVNLIEFNPYHKSKFKGSSVDAICNFARILDKKGIRTMIRYKKGEKVKGACGQLGADML